MHDTRARCKQARWASGGERETKPRREARQRERCRAASRRDLARRRVASAAGRERRHVHIVPRARVTQYRDRQWRAVTTAPPQRWRRPQGAPALHTHACFSHKSSNRLPWPGTRSRRASRPRVQSDSAAGAARAQARRGAHRRRRCGRLRYGTNHHRRVSRSRTAQPRGGGTVARATTVHFAVTPPHPVCAPPRGARSRPPAQCARGSAVWPPPGRRRAGPRGGGGGAS